MQIVFDRSRRSWVFLDGASADDVARFNDRRPGVLAELIYEHSRVSGGSFQLDASSWAIHGFIPVDGDVILAKFGSKKEADDAITQLQSVDHL